MSWPSFYGYKYTPIGLRQREVKDEGGKLTFSTTVHLPEGGHLLDIERRVNPDGSVSKTETSCFAPSALPAAPAPRSTTPRAVDPYFGNEGRPVSDLERQADDIIANFRARQGTGLERGQVSEVSDGMKYTQKQSQSRAEMSLSAKEESQRTSSRHTRRQGRDFMDDF